MDQASKGKRSGLPAIALLCLSSSLMAACNHDSASTPVMGIAGSPPSVSASSVVGGVLASARDRYNLPAMAGVVVRSDGVADLDAVGVRKLGEPGLVTSDDRFHIGSNLKAITATMIGVLVERRLLSWTSTLGDTFVDHPRDIDLGYRNVTLEQILQHRGGMPPFTDSGEFASLPDLDGPPEAQRAAFARWLLKSPPASPVGEYRYSNAGYVIAAAMAEQVTAISWETLMQGIVFTPLDLQAVFGWPASNNPQQPWGHYPLGGLLIPQDPNDPAWAFPVFARPAGDLSVSLGDYARFLQLHLQGLRGQDTLLRSATFVKLHKPMGEYAMGWLVVSRRGVTTSTHDGSAGSFYITTWLQASRDLAVAVAANAGGPDASRACADAASELLDRY